MTKYILTYEQDKEFGGLGFRLEGTSLDPQEYNMATDGVLIAHDILEHINGVQEIGTIGDELEALGAIWYTRGEFSDITRGRPSRYNAYEELAADIVRIGVNRLLCNEGYHKPVPNVKIENDLMQTTIESIIYHAKKGLKLELEGEDYNQQDFNQYFEDVARFFIVGHRKAVKKYAYIGQMQANNVFWNIAETIDNALKDMAFEGQQIELHVNKTQNKVSWNEYYGEDYYLYG